MTVPPGRRTPFRSASSIIFCPMRSFPDPPGGREDVFPLPLLDLLLPEAVLHGPARVEHLHLREDEALRVRHQAGELDEGRVADRLKDVLEVSHGPSPPRGSA